MNENPAERPAIFRSAPLIPTDARRAYPLVRLFISGMELSDWLAYARSFSRSQSRNTALRCLEDERGYIHAIYAFDIRRDLRHGKLLRVSDVIMGHLPGSTLAEILLGSIAEIASERGCDSVMIELGKGSPARRSLCEAGFEQFEIRYFLSDRALKLADHNA